MEALPAPPGAKETLAVIGHRIRSSLISVKRDLGAQEAEDSLASALVNESQRFGLWAKNLGLYDLGHSSLDYRLRDAPMVYKYTRSLLVDLEASIWKIQQDLDQRKPGREIVAEQAGRLETVSEQATEIGRDYDEKQNSDESSEDEEALMSYQEDSMPAVILENARLIIDRLYKLSFQIRSSATRLGSFKAKEDREIDEETGVVLMDWYASEDLRQLDEDSTLGDQGSKATDIDDQESMSSLSDFKKSDKKDLHEEETEDSWEQWDTKTARNVATTETARQKDIQPLKPASMKADSNPLVAAFTEVNSRVYQSKRNNDRPASVAVAGIMNLSFYVRIDPLEPDCKAQPIQRGIWTPPTIRNGFTRRNGLLFHWIGGTMTVVGTNDPVNCSLNQTYSAATVFTQYPDTPHLLVVPFDAQLTHPYQNNGGWQPLFFFHPPQLGNTQRTYSTVSAFGDRQQIAAPGSQHWMPQLLPRFYDCQPGSSRIQAGLIGSIPILIALAAFSAPPNVLAGVLTTCIQPRAWQPHQFQYPAGHIPKRGMVVTIFFDPMNPQGSNAAILNRLQDGTFGPFYS